jgi:hypothetical protein
LPQLPCRQAQSAKVTGRRECAAGFRNACGTMDCQLSCGAAAKPVSSHSSLPCALICEGFNASALSKAFSGESAFTSIVYHAINCTRTRCCFMCLRATCLVERETFPACKEAAAIYDEWRPPGAMAGVSGGELSYFCIVQAVPCDYQQKNLAGVAPVEITPVSAC